MKSPLSPPLLFLLVLLIAPAHPALSQQSLTTRPPKPIADLKLYQFLFHYSLHLEAKHPNVSLEQNGDLADLFGRQLGLNTTDAASVVREAHVCEQQVGEVDRLAAKIIDSVRQNTPKGKMPVLPPELADLQQRKNAIITQHVILLRASLGPDSSTRLDIGAHKHFTVVSQVPLKPAQPGATQVHPQIGH